MTTEERFERIEKNLDKLTEMLSEIGEDISRLERISGVLLINDEELDRRLNELEAKPRSKPS